MCVCNKLNPVLQVVGVSGRRLVRRAGVHHGGKAMMKAMMLMKQKDQAIASGSVVLQGLVVGATLAVVKVAFETLC